MVKAWIISIVAIIGVLFSGFLTFYNAIGACPLIEGCSELFGLPSCVYGLIIFGAILLFSIIKTDLIRITSIVGVGFSAAMSIIDLFIAPSPYYSLGLPSCIYGLAMYVVILVLTFIKSKNE